MVHGHTGHWPWTRYFGFYNRSLLLLTFILIVTLSQKCIDLCLYSIMTVAIV